MNKLPLSRRAAIVRALADGASARAVARITGSDKDTVLRVLVEVGEFCSTYQNIVLRNLPCTRVEADEIWSYCGAKEANKTNAGQGDLWTYTAICADTKLIFSWIVGSRSSISTHAFMHDMASRLKNRIQLSTDGLAWYKGAVESAFGWNGCDFAQLQKKYATPDGISGRFAQQSICVGADKEIVMGNPDLDLCSTSYVERSNLQLRMNNKRFTRSTNSFSKKAENHAHAVSLAFMVYNFVRAHGTLTKNAKGIKTTPAMAAGLTDRVWSVEDILSRMEPSYQIAA